MKFKNVKLGTRFYIFISEDEYKIITLVKKDKKKNQFIFMDEESFDLKTITQEELKEYTMLSNNYDLVLSNFRPTSYFSKTEEYKNQSIWLSNENIINFLDNQFLSYPFKITISFKITIYSLMRKTVFDRMINYIIQLNFPQFQISKHEEYDDIESIWEEYFRFINEKNFIIDCNSYSDKINMDDIVNNKAKIPDAIIDEAEQLLNVPILSYDPYEFDDSINLNNVNMKYFFIYINDKYYIILYVIDTVRESIEIQTNLQNHMDVVKFMLK